MGQKQQSLKDIIYSNYMRETNMSLRQLMRWKRNPLSKMASQSRSPINMAVKLHFTPRSQWPMRYYKWAMKAISYLRRAKRIKSRNYVPGTRITFNEIALRNWGFDAKKR